MTVLCWITCPDEACAQRIARTVVEERLAACANVLPTMSSWYWWDGRLEQSQEAALLCKTRPDLVDALTARVKELHPYQVPCVVALPVTGGNPAFLAWVASETRPG